MNCHAIARKNKPEIVKLTKYYDEGIALPWKRVHRVPDYAYFNHSVHVNKGIECASMPWQSRRHGWRDAGIGVYYGRLFKLSSQRTNSACQIFMGLKWGLKIVMHAIVKRLSMETTKDKHTLKRRSFFIRLFGGIGGGWMAGNLFSKLVHSTSGALSNERSS